MAKIAQEIRADREDFVGGWGNTSEIR